MCGIAGKFNFDSANPIDRERLSAMTSVIAHRGPDADGFYVGEGIGLGHRRLSIIDLSTGDQPLANENGTIWIVFNGEVYNFAEIRAELEAHGHWFRTHSDTEVIVHAYEQWGDRAVDRFRGMFAFALSAPRSRRCSRIPTCRAAGAPKRSTPTSRFSTCRRRRRCTRGSSSCRRRICWWPSAAACRCAATGICRSPATAIPRARISISSSSRRSSPNRCGCVSSATCRSARSSRAASTRPPSSPRWPMRAAPTAS
ncbi:MAG: hypothetical protein DMF93_00625 [Acidobacteria bacterium]|nr:MAG: hypothetical protein DMF93_00625 [Acidobacteriota bacterium]